MELLKICFLVLALCGFHASAEDAPSYKCDFERGICSFLKQDRANRENWKLGKGKQNSGDTGPSVDHTLGTDEGGYLYVNVSAARTYDVKIMTNPPFKEKYCLQFFYHMYGPSVGELAVEARENFAVKPDVIRYFKRSRTQGDRWKEAVFTINPNSAMRRYGYMVVFTALEKTAYASKGDIAIDDISLSPGNCPENKKNASTVCTFDEYQCGYSTTRTNSLNWEWKSEKSKSSYFQTLPDIDHTLGTPIGGYWFAGTTGKVFGSSTVTAVLNSREYSKPKGSLNCLHFYYYIDGDGHHWMWGDVKQAYIQVHLNFPSSSSGRTWLITKAKNTTDHRQWTYVEVSANITEPKYQIQFTAVLQSPTDALLAIDDVKLVPGNCPAAGSCDFEEDKCSWVDGSEGYNWVRKTGKSRVNNEIGPAKDNKDNENGNYIVFSTQYKQPGARASLESEVFIPTTEEMCLDFYYNMKGANLGNLRVRRIEENITQSTLWSLSGDQGGIWKKGVAVMKPSIIYNKVVFRGTLGTGQNAYMALDDIRIRKGVKCELKPNDADPRIEAMELLTCTFDDKSLCSWKQDSSTLSWKFGSGTLMDNSGPKQPVNGRGHYIFVSSYEGSQTDNTIARIQSPIVSSYYPEPTCLSFSYHMFGANVGELRVYLVVMQDETTTLGRHVIWRRKGTQPDKWMQFKDSLAGFEGDYKIEIEADGGPGFIGYIAIDEVMVSLGACPETVEMCDFEKDACFWSIERDKEKAFYWQRGSALPKGPQQDHTTGTDFGYYLQAFADDNAKTEAITSFVSIKYSRFWGPHCLTFWYNRPGVDVGKLSVIIRGRRTNTPLWHVIKDVGRFWHYGQVTINVKEDIQVVIQAEKGSSSEYTMAIDDVLIKNSVCGRAAACNFNTGYCSYFMNETSDFSWLVGTGRVENPDFFDIIPPDRSLENDLYAYVDMTSSNLTNGQQAVLVSDIIDAPSQGISCVTFYYHMNGEDNCTFSIGKQSLNNKNTAMHYTTRDYASTNDKTTGWTPMPTQITGTVGEKFQIYFTAIRGSGPKCFIAVEDISVQDGPCEEPTTPPPVTPTPMPSSSLTCNFDKANLCEWKDDGSKLKWLVNVPTKPQERMPKFDHTQGNYQGRYAYILGDMVSVKNGSMTSQITNYFWYGKFCFSLWYYMDVEGSNRLQVTAEHSSSHYSTRSYIPFWSREGNTGYRWRHAYVHINSLYYSPRVRIIGTVKSGVIAVDDFEAKIGTCPPSKMCTFDDGDDMCGFAQDSMNSVDWEVKSADNNDTVYGIPDHTTQSVEGQYLFISFNGTSKEPSQISRIYSPKRPPSPTGYCVTFYYHIYNLSRLSFNTYIATENGLSDPQWTVSIGQGLLWHGARLPVVSQMANWQVAFEVAVGSRGYGQVALDDISVENGPCPDPGYCDFDSENCLWENVKAPLKEVKSSPEMYVQNADVPTDLLNDDFDWVRHIGEDFFGPRQDHTYKTPQGFYLLLDTRFEEPQRKAVYMSERLRTSGGSCLKLWYAIPNDAEAASLLVYTTSDFKMANQLKLIKDNTNEKWKEALISVIPVHTSDTTFLDYWIFLSGTTGNSITGYIAIDDISISDGICEDKTELFDCKNGKHVHDTDVCNFHKDCSNGLDESKCADCDFESSTCGWSSAITSQSFRWIRSRAGKENLPFDHTKQDASGYFITAAASRYMYSANLNTQLQSSVLRNAFSTCTLQFWYNILSKMKLSVIMSRNNKSVEIWVPEVDSEETWTEANVFLGRITRAFQIAFKADRERSDDAHAAVDDIIMQGCDASVTGRPGSCTSDQFNCKNGRCVSKDNICDYTDDCGNFEDESFETCASTISRCSFDLSYCSWISDNTTNNQWHLKKPFTSLDEGPTRDHTSGNGQFLYIPGRIRSVPARLYGPLLQRTEGCQIRLYYDIRGKGEISLQIKTRTASNGEERVVWSREDPTEGYFFAEDRFTFNETDSFQVIIEGSLTIGTGKVNYIALDDMSFNYKCVPHTQPLPTLPPVLTTPNPEIKCGFGKFQCTKFKQCLDIAQKCDFYKDCADGSDEDHCGQCDFHEDMCGLVNVAVGSRYKWQRVQAETFALEKNSTLPDKDSIGNTLGYFAVLTGKGYSNYYSNTVMRTPILGATAPSCKMEFFYHFNIRGGLFEVYISQTGYGAKVKRFSQRTNTGKNWQFATVQIGNYPRGKMIEFHGNSYNNVMLGQVQDIAVDNINYVNCDPNEVFNESLKCNFDKDQCGWHPDNIFSKATWTRANYQPQNYGPKTAHSKKDGYFMYLMASTILRKGDKGHLLSLKQHPTNNTCFSFWYHMFGQDVGTLNIIIRTDKENSTIWSKTNSQGNVWKQGMRTIRSLDPYSVVIEGIVGSFARPVIAIDDIDVYDDECPHPVACEFEADFCEWTSNGWVLQIGKGNVPSKDHTTETEFGRYAALTEDSGTLTSPEYNYTMNDYCLNFWYFMEGNRNTTLSVLKANPVVSDSADAVWNEAAEPNIKGEWIHARADVKDLAGEDYNIIISGSRAGEVGSIAVDDVAIENGACPPTGSCTFERDFCTWRNLKRPVSTGLQWLRNSGHLTKNGEGPSKDHTTNSSDGWYIYLESKFGSLGQTAVLESENLHYQPTVCLKFWYFMDSWGSGSLQVVYVNHTDSRIYNVRTYSGGAGSKWNDGKLLVKGLPKTYKMRFIGKKGYSGYLALDDILIIEADTCDEIIITTAPPTEFPKSLWDCDFENGHFCSWINGYSWVIQDGRKALLSGKGPSSDHTRGNALGRYAYYNPHDNETHDLISATIDTATSDYCFRFWYYMHSSVPLSLEIHALQYDHTVGPIWLKKSSSGFKWKYGSYFLAKSANISLIFRPRRTQWNVGDIALDDIQFNKGNCPVVKGQPCDFESADICGFKLESDDGISWKRIQAKSVVGEIEGPKLDKTYNSNEGHFLIVYPSATARVSGDNKAWVVMPSVPSTGDSKSCVRFWYQMSGKNVIALKVYMRTPLGSLPLFPFWSHETKYGNNTWRVGQLTIEAPYTHEIVFEGVMQRGNEGFIALDDVVVKEGGCPPPGTCNFEDDMCTWTNAEKGATVEWIRNTGSTPTKETGPDIDHTIGTDQGSYVYLHGNSTDKKRNMVGILQSEFFTASTNRCLSFWAHMNGSDMGTLQVNFSYYNDYKIKTLTNKTWGLERTQGTRWFNRLINVNTKELKLEDEYQIIFIGTTKGIYSDIALDDIEVTDNACYTVQKDKFNCFDGKFVNHSKVCDFEKDCGTGEDEANCGTCDFEHGSCGWKDESSYNYYNVMWTRVQGQDESNGKVNGPGYDHTSNSSSGYFMLLNTASSWYSVTANLRSSETLLKTSYASCVMDFYYIFTPGSQATLSVKKRFEKYASSTVWEQQGNTYDGWQLGSAYLGTTELPFFMTFTMKTYQRPYLAIDDISFRNCSLPEKRSKCNRNTEFRCDNDRCISKYVLCDQTDDCGDRSDEKRLVCSKYLKPCTFEYESVCEWTVKGKTKNYWYDTFSVSSRGQTISGPLVDHTKGTDGAGKYLQLKKYYDENAVSAFHSPNYQVSKGSFCTLRFYYYMQGADDAQLKVYTEIEKEGWKWQETNFNEFGSLGQMWNRAVVNITDYTPFHFIIAGNPGNTTGNIIGIDDISLTEGCQPYSDELPTPLPTLLPTVYPCKDNEFKCEKPTPLCIPKEKACDFTSDCSDGSDEIDCGPCDFTNNFCGWQNESPGSYQWTRRNISAVSSYGPNFNHENSSEGWYACVTKSYSFYELPAGLISPPLPPTSSHCVLAFWLFTAAETSGQFSVEYKGTTFYDRQFKQIWKMPTSFPNEWQLVEVKIPKSDNKGTRVKFLSKPSWGWFTTERNVAIDELKFMNCNPKELLVDCDFEDGNFNNGTCFWTQNELYTIKWKRGKGSTDLNFTGPTSDHTTGHGYYMYIDPGDRPYRYAKLTSPTLPMNEPEGSCFSFWYHMYGQHVGTLSVETSLYWSYQRKWTQDRNQGNKWLLGEVRVKSSKDFTIQVSALSTRGKENNIAVDDFKMIDGPCPQTSICDFEIDFCGWKDTSDGLARWIRTQGSGNWSDEKPMSDHTTNSESGYFLILPYKKNAFARIESPLYKNYGEMCMKFWYNMFGNDIGSLEVYQRVWQEGSKEIEKSLWKRSGDHAGGWKLGRVTMKSLPSYSISIEAKTDIGPLGYIALDDIHVSHGSCSDPASCNFEIDTCGWSNAVAFADVDWIRRTGLDNNFGKGPSQDHGTVSAQGHYMYALLTGLTEGAQSMLVSEDLDIYPNYCLTLWYNMFNTINSSFVVQQVLIGMGWETVVELKSSEVESDVWAKLEMNITVEDAGDFFQIGLSAFVFGDQDNKTGRGVALDDVSLVKSLCGQEIITTPVPPTPTPEYPYSKYDCDFEGKKKCIWENDPVMQAKWKIETGHSERKLSRPWTDHTTKSTIGHYLTLDDDSAKSFYVSTARYICHDGIDPAPQNVCFKFWYHMYGNDPGTLYLKTQNYHDADKTEVMWSRSKSQGLDWKYEQIHIVKDYHYRLVFERVGTRHGDVSLDDFSLNYGPCPPRQYCDVEQDYCGFSHDPEGDFQWRRGNGSRTNGPDIDHTYGSKFGNYFYVDPKERIEKDKMARLETGLYQPDQKCMRFWYYLYGKDVGTLEVLVRNGDSQVSKWKENGDFTEFWHGSEVILGETLPSSYSYIFQVTVGSDYGNGSIALDDISVKTECPPFGSCNFEEDACLWMNDGTTDLQWVRGSGEVTASAPLNDVTLGNQFGTYLYVHISASWISNPTPARLYSPYFHYSKQLCINYWNFRNGTDFTGAISVYIYDVELDNQTLMQYFVKENLGRWTNQQVEIDEDQDEGKYQIIFEAELTNVQDNFIAIDDITVYEGACKPIAERKPEFSCDGGKTEIPDDFRCDFFVDCKDGLDEANCGLKCDFETVEQNPCHWVSKTTPGYSSSWNQTLANVSDNPNLDHTKGIPGEGYFMKLNSLAKYDYSANARLKSPALIQSSRTCRMFFWFYLYGVYNVEYIAVSYDAGHESTRAEMFRLTGDQGKSWKLAEVVIGRIHNRFSVDITGDKRAKTGVIAIDDISFENCDIPRPLDEPKTCGKNEYMCTNKNCIPKDLVCDFVDDCGDHSDENILIAKCEKYPGRCDFENNHYCGWQPVEYSDSRWPIVKPSLSSYYNKIFINRDHTKNTPTGRFLHFTNNQHSHGRVARIASKVMEVIDETCKIRFFYTYGTTFNSTKYDQMTDIGALTVYIRIDTENVWQTIFTAKEPPGQYFESVILPLDSKHPFEVIIESRIGSTLINGGWAVDDISFTPGCMETNKTLPVSIKEPTPEPEEKCEAGQFLCAVDKRCIDDDQVCDFAPDCSDASDEAKCGTCSFDDDNNPTCGWKDARGEKWRRTKGKQGLNGLISDVSGNGYYMYVTKQTTAAVSSLAILRSVQFQQSSSTCEVIFYYFMSGIRNNDTSLKLQLQTKDRHDVMLWRETSDHGPNWQNTTVSIGRRLPGWHLDFIGTHVLSKGDIAIDEIKFSKCVLPEKRKCADKQEFACLSGECINSTLVCDFSLDCPDGSDESNCFDFLERCNFEKDFCGWYQDPKSDQKWNLTSGAEIAEGSGPDRDHTIGDETGHFLMTQKASTHFFFYTARIRSTAFMADTSGNCRLRFWHHMYTDISDASYSSIAVYLQFADDPRLRKVKSWSPSTGDIWERAEVPLVSKFNFHVIIEGNPRSYKGREVSLDDTSFTLECVPVYTIITTPIPTIRPKGYCESKGLFACDDYSCVPMDAVCDFKVDCKYGKDERSCPAFCDFELGSNCGWKAITKLGDGVEIAITIAGDAKNLSAYAPGVDKTTNSSQGSYLLVHSSVEAETVDTYTSPTFATCASACKFSFWYSARTSSFMRPTIILNTENDTIEMSQLERATDWTRQEMGIGRQRGNFSILIRKRGSMYQSDYIAIDDIEFVNCALPVKEEGLCYGFPCKTSRACISDDQVCDLTDDCGDRSDEENCETISIDFENGLGIFKQWERQFAPLKWEIRSGSANGHLAAKVGPVFDHTLSNNEGHYAFMTRGIFGKMSQKALLRSETLYIKPVGQCEMRFYYYMYGETINALNIFTITQEDGDFKSLWNQTGQVGNFWMRGSVTLKESDSFQVIIQGKAGVATTDIIALDDISFSRTCKLQEGQTLPPKGITTPGPTTTLKPTNCKPTEFECVKDKACIPGIKKCDFRVDCKDGSDEVDCVKPTCNFQDPDLCGWAIQTNYRSYARVKRDIDESIYQWIRIQANNLDTTINLSRRPKTDHSNNSTTGWYLLADGGPGSQGDITSLVSPQISATHSQCALDFWYYCEKWTCRLQAYTIQEGKPLEKVWDSDASFYKAGSNQVWMHGKAALNATNYQVRFDAVRPHTYLSAMCLDDITFENCAPPRTVDDTKEICDVGEAMCSNNKCIPQNLLCDFNNDCGDNSDESDLKCQAYEARCDFETGPCPKWHFEKDKNVDFVIVKARKSFLLSTVPQVDHTTKSDTGSFASVSRGYSVRATAKPKIRSDTINGQQSKTCTVRFWYNMMEASNEIRVFKRTSYDETDYKFKQEFSTDSLNFWHRAEVEIIHGNDGKDYQIVLEAILDKTYGSVSIDDISLTPECIIVKGKELPNKPTAEPPLINDCTLDGLFSCNTTKKCYNHVQKCNFVDDCGDNTDEAGCGTNCDFENGTCGWYNTYGLRGKWIVSKGRRYYNGLDKDHTKKTADGHYLTPTNLMSLGEIAQLRTHMYVASGGNCKMSLWYYMDETRGAKLSVILQLHEEHGKYEEVLQIDQDGGDKWVNAIANIRTRVNFTVIIQAKMGNSYLSSLAIDDIEFITCPSSHPPVECSNKEYTCKDGLRCINNWQYCDGWYDCDDKSDEFKCPTLHGDCNFDNDTWLQDCDWQNKEELDFKWSRAKEGRSNDTGPSRNQNLRQGGYFLYIDSSKQFSGDKAGIMTPIFKASSGKCHLRFWYFMKGSTSLATLEVFSEGEKGESFRTWTRKGPQGNAWVRGHVLIGNSQNYRVSFVATRGGDDKTDIALDEVKFTHGCEEGGDLVIPTGPTPFCSKGEFRCRSGECIEKAGRCNCQYECEDNSDEEGCDISCVVSIIDNKVTKNPVTWNPPTVLPREHCKTGHKLCEDGVTCIPGLLLCDGVEDCPDGSDERYGCTFLCEEEFYFCKDQASPPCIHRERLCDGTNHCIDGSDESLCDKCPKDFCRNQGNCSITNHVPVCQCKPEYSQNRCYNLKVSPDLDKIIAYQDSGVGWVIGVVIGTILLISILFVVWYKRNTNAERTRLAHAVDNPVYGLNLDTLTFGELNSHMPVRHEDGAGATAIENPLYAFKSEIK